MYRCITLMPWEGYTVIRIPAVKHDGNAGILDGPTHIWFEHHWDPDGEEHKI